MDHPRVRHTADCVKSCDRAARTGQPVPISFQDTQDANRRPEEFGLSSDCAATLNDESPLATHFCASYCTRCRTSSCPLQSGIAARRLFVYHGNPALSREDHGGGGGSPGYRAARNCRSMRKSPRKHPSGAGPNRRDNHTNKTFAQQPRDLGKREYWCNLNNC